ncbi:MAG: lipoate--protein ligase family protein [Verrucomicrobia bacterium]|nr:lipoate--protein ligase family protein [Verrucomicrobiota bacterium]
MTLLDLTLPSPAENLALDEALLDAAEAGERGEVLRFWESPTPFVVVGYANKIAAEVNVAACEAKGIPILRRCTGGGTVVQGPGCLNYALILRINETGPTRSISSANQFIMERNLAAIASLNPQPPTLDLSIRGHTDLALGDLKFSGNAQRRRKQFLLFHGTFLHSFDLSLINQLLHMPSAQPDYRDNRAHDAFVTNLKLSPVSIRGVIAKTWDAVANSLAPPLQSTALLVREKYSQAEWNRKF